MYKKLLILLFVCSSAFAMDDRTNDRQRAGLLPPLPLLLGSVSDHQEAHFATVEMERGVDLRQQVAQECTIFGVKCSECELDLSAESEGMLAEEVRRHLWVGHGIIATGNEVEHLLGGKKPFTEDTIFA